jgi:hypothetical protein
MVALLRCLASEGRHPGKNGEAWKLASCEPSRIDGAIARCYLPREWRAVTDGLFKIESIRIYGLKTDVIPLPHGRLKSIAEAVVPDALARFLTNRMRMGSFVVAHMRKK